MESEIFVMLEAEFHKKTQVWLNVFDVTFSWTDQVSKLREMGLALFSYGYTDGDVHIEFEITNHHKYMLAKIKYGI